jgi:hypothetical protein
MRRKVAYGIEIAARDTHGEWQVLTAKAGLFSRKPKPTARSIIERWIHEQSGQLRGGRVVIVGPKASLPRQFETTVRVRILDFEDRTRELAAAYIGSDVPAEPPQVDRWELPMQPDRLDADRVPVSSGVGNG